MKEKENKFKSDTFLPEDSTGEIKTLIELSEDLIFYLDEKGTIKNINKNGAFLLGYEVSGLIGKYFIEFIKPTARPLLLKAFNQVIDEDKISVLEIPLISKDKIEIPFKFRIKSVLEESQTKIIIGFGKNLSLIKKLEDKVSEMNEQLKETRRIINIERSRSREKISLLEELNKMKTEFVSNISHEFRTPLASIIGFSESIASDPSMLQEHKKEFNEIILSEGKRLAKLINDVLDLTRLEKGETELNKIKFNIVTLLDQVIEKNKLQAKNKGLTFTSELPSEKIIIKGDKERLSQVFNNLFENAIKFTGKGGRISVFTHSFYKEFEVIITDTGIGIQPKDIPYLFQKYYTDGKSIKPAIEKGLGLVFVKHIVDLHNGSISIKSEVNEGTTVIVKLLKEE